MKSENKKQWSGWRVGWQKLLAGAMAAGLVACAGEDPGEPGAAPEPGVPGVPAEQPGKTPEPGTVPPPDRDEDQHDSERAASYVPRQLLVRFKSGTQGVRALSVHAQHQAQVVQSFRVPSDLQLVELPEGVSVEQAMAQYRRDPSVLYVQPNYQYRINERIPSDPRFNELWGMHNVGFGAFDADIDAPEAWDITTGSHDVIVGVLDTGIEYGHEDLFENVFSNPGEIAGNGADDDGNGFVDDVHGINAFEGTGDPFDDNGHGTHVSGTIAGRGDNGIGVAGVSWDAQIVSCKAFDAWGGGSDAAILTCMDYFLALKTRAQDPVDIVATNNSWGGGPFSQALLDAIETHRQAGMLFVAAAGNDWGNNNDQSPFYPASYESENVIAVAATDYYDGLAYFSNFGPRSVDVGAPGEFILSSTPWGYDYFDGTSMATPHVTGLVALLKGFDPSLTPAALKNLILTGGDQTYGTDGLTLSGRRINAFGSLTCQDRVLFNRFAPAADQVTVSLGDSLPLGVLSIDCAQPSSDPQTVTVLETGEVIQLADTSSTGSFTGSFRPGDVGSFTLQFSSGDIVAVNVVVNYDQARVVDYQYRDIAGTPLPLYWAHDVVELASPFPIRFGNLEPGYETISVGSNGTISFTDYIGDHAQAFPIAHYQTVLSPFWDHLDPYGDGVTYAVLGAAPNRELVIDWNDVSTWSGGSVSFQVVFFENSAEILFSYADVIIGDPYYDNGAATAVGVQVSSTIARQFSLFEPSLSDEMTLLWSMGTPIASAGPDQVVALGAPVALDGSASRDFNGEIAFHAWDQTAGTPVLLQDADEAVARFTAPATPGTLTFQLSVVDDEGNVGTDTTNVIINQAPIARAGNDFRLANHLRGTLDGGASTDPGGHIIGYAWRQLSGEAVQLSGANTALATFTAPATPQYLVFELTVYDEHGFSGLDLVVVEIFANDAPVASAGADFIARPGGVAALDGSASHDPDGAIVRYAWETTMCVTVQGPCTIDLIDADTAAPVFEMPGASSLIQLRLTVTDGPGATSSDTVTVVGFLQAPEAAIAPLASCASAGSPITLDGSRSVDLDGTLVSYHWQQLAGPPVAIGSNGIPAISFTVPGTQEALVFALTVTDDDGLSDTTTVTIPVNAPPVADALASAAVVLSGHTVTLDASRSQDAVSYAWAQTGGTPVTLSNSGSVFASFVAPALAAPFDIATFALTVSDACGATATDTVSVIVVRN
jgi:serine protease